MKVGEEGKIEKLQESNYLMLWAEGAKPTSFAARLNACSL